MAWSNKGEKVLTLMIPSKVFDNIKNQMIESGISRLEIKRPDGLFITIEVMSTLSSKILENIRKSRKKSKKNRKKSK